MSTSSEAERAAESPKAAAGAEEEVVFLELPAPEGWKKKFIPKSSGASRRNEIIFISPTGEELKTRKQLDQYLKSHPGGPSSAEFDWGTGDTPRRSARISEKAKAVDSPETDTPKKRGKRSSSKEGSSEKRGSHEGDEAVEEETESPDSGPPKKRGRKSGAKKGSAKKKGAQDEEDETPEDGAPPEEEKKGSGDVEMEEEIAPPEGEKKESGDAEIKEETTLPEGGKKESADVDMEEDDGLDKGDGKEDENAPPVEKKEGGDVEMQEKDGGVIEDTASESKQGADMETKEKDDGSVRGMEDKEVATKEMHRDSGAEKEREETATEVKRSVDVEMPEDGKSEKAQEETVVEAKETAAADMSEMVGESEKSEEAVTEIEQNAGVETQATAHKESIGKDVLPPQNDEVKGQEGGNTKVGDKVVEEKKAEGEIKEAEQNDRIESMEKALGGEKNIEVPSASELSSPPSAATAKSAEDSAENGAPCEREANADLKDVQSINGSNMVPPPEVES